VYLRIQHILTKIKCTFSQASHKFFKFLNVWQINKTILFRTSEDQPPVVVVEEQYEFYLEINEKRLRNIFLVILTSVFLLVIFKFPPIHCIKMPQLNHTNLSKIDSLIAKNVHMIKQYRRYTIFRMDNYIYLLISLLLVIIFSILNKKEKRNENEDDDRSSTVVHFFLKFVSIEEFLF
jgi:hypothetical protein